MDGKASAIARNNRNCATTNLVGGWERATIPLLFSRWSAAYWGDLSCTGGAAVFVGWAQSIFPNFVEIIFLLNSIALCLLSTSASLHYWCTPRLHSRSIWLTHKISELSVHHFRSKQIYLQILVIFDPKKVGHDLLGVVYHVKKVSTIFSIPLKVIWTP